MIRRYSRLSKLEEKRNIRSAFIFSFLTIASILILIFLGLPSIAKFAAFLSDIKKSGQPVEKKDTTPPAPPKLDPLPESTNKIEIEIKGKTEPGATVTIFLNSKKEEILSNNEGGFIYSFVLQGGENFLSAQSRDNAGNESQKTQDFKIIYDNNPPDLEITTPEDGSEFFGPKQRQVVIEGKTEEGASLNINERLVVVDSEGNFTFVSTLSEGENMFTIKAKDKAGNETEKTLALHFFL